MILFFVTLECTIFFLVLMSGGLLTSGSSPVLWTDIAAHGTQALTATVCCALTFYGRNLYDLRRVDNLYEFTKRLPVSLLIVGGLYAALHPLLSRLSLLHGSLATFFLTLLFTVPTMLLTRWILYRFINAPLLMKRVMILGTNALACSIAREIEAAPDCRYQIVGFVADTDDSSRSGRFPRSDSILGSLQLFDKIVETYRPDRIIVSLTERRQRLPVHELLDTCVQGIQVEDGIHVHERLTGKLEIDSIQPSALIFSTMFQKSRYQIVTRRLLNILIASIALMLTAPLMLCIALLIKLDSPGNVFFVQDRAGLRGKPFRLLKFRTMYPPSSDRPESVWNRDVASRLTRLGKWLRKLYLDELPQFINVLRGDMNVVGPRPEMMTNIDTMKAQIPYYSLRSAIRPGLTGWAQVKQGYAMSQEDVMEKMRYDLYYIKHMSLLLDLRILIDTAKMVFTHRGT